MASKLSTYKQKRKFDKTPEPTGGAPSETERLYVIQKHDASRLHYDFRLEHDGVLLSWAVPKGPSLDPSVKRLAVQVEDHPVGYGSFEGIIPKGQYGGGTVLLWDRGTWEPIGDVDKMLKAGDLKFRLHGQRLRGTWALVQMKGEEGKNWLLIKHRDDDSIDGDQDGIVLRFETSVKLESKAKDVLDYKTFCPQLATLTEHVPEGDEWLHEVKLDGYRIIAWHTSDGVHLMSRNGLDWTDKFSQLAKQVKKHAPKGSALDGEVVIFDKQGKSDFGALQQWFKEGKEFDPVYVVFDLIEWEGESFISLPLRERKDRLKHQLESLPAGADEWIRFSDHWVGQGKELVAEACKANLEGIISKRVTATYHQARTRDWLKLKCIQQEEFVIGGYTKPSGERTGFGALLLGQYDDKGQLQYVGKVGTGFQEKDLKDLLGEMTKLHRSSSPFAPSETPIPPRKAWLKPKLVAQIRYGERTKAGILRHSVFLGLRPDKEAKEVKPEIAIEDAEPKITHPERVMFPDSGVTKLDIAEYYEKMADRILQFIHDRPLALVRCPEGIEGECFFQKHISQGMLKTMERKGKPGETLVVVNTVEELLNLAQFSTIEIHNWGSKLPKIESPDLLIFDLDPGPGIDWKTVVQSAEVTREFLKNLGLPSFAKTTGGKGIHVVVPLKVGTVDWPELKKFAKAVTVALAGLVPNQFVTVSTKAKREKRIFIDYLRNGRGATAVAPYTVRMRPHAPVSVPVEWDELNDLKSAAEFRIMEVDSWLPSEKQDPWRDFEKSRTSITKKMISTLREYAPFE